MFLSAVPKAFRIKVVQSVNSVYLLYCGFKVIFQPNKVDLVSIDVDVAGPVILISGLAY
jgi:hypothetical protein